MVAGGEALGMGLLMAMRLAALELYALEMLAMAPCCCCCSCVKSWASLSPMELTTWMNSSRGASLMSW